MTFNGVTFNHLYWVGKTLQEFLKHEGHHGLPINQLEEAFYIINPGAKAKVHGNDNQVIGKGKDSKAGSSNKTGNNSNKG
jgi:hypothetical protein